MNRKLALLAATLLATSPALAQTQQQRAQAAQGQAGQPQSNAPASTGARAEVTTTAEFLRLATMLACVEIEVRCGELFCQCCNSVLPVVIH